MHQISLKLCAVFLLVLLAIGNSYADDKTIIVQSTTSTQNSGLFDFLLPKFKQQTGITVNIVAVGTGQALNNGRNGDGDVLLVHAKSAEDKFVADGYGIKRYDVMYNDFIIVGPQNDPAKVGGTKDVTLALQKISATKSPFVSRGDNSGTNQKERNLWKSADIEIKFKTAKWYRETGSGMGATLNIAAGMGAYTLSDRATWIAFANKSDMQILSQGDPKLFNQYGVILVSPKRHAHVKSQSGQAFISWLTGPEGQKAIGSYQIDGKQLFFPNAP